MPPPGRPNSFDFMQFSGKFGVFTPPLEGSRPPSGKSWIRHWRWPKFTLEYPPPISENAGDRMWRLICNPKGYHSFLIADWWLHGFEGERVGGRKDGITSASREVAINILQCKYYRYFLFVTDIYAFLMCEKWQR